MGKEALPERPPTGVYRLNDDELGKLIVGYVFLVQKFGPSHCFLVLAESRMEQTPNGLFLQ